MMAHSHPGFTFLILIHAEHVFPACL